MSIEFADTGLKIADNVLVETVDNDTITDSLRLTQQTLRFGGQRYELVLGIETLNKRGNKPGILKSHFARHRHHTSFTTKMPQELGCEVRTNAAIRLFGNHAIDATDIAITPTAAISQIDIGRYITMGTDPKIYQIVAHTATGFTIEPGLRVAQLANTALDLDPDSTVRYASSTPRGLPYARGLVVTSVHLVEQV